MLLVKPRQSVLVPEKEKMPLMKAITELGSEDDDTLAFSRSQMEEYLREAADTNPIHQGEAAVLPGFLVMNACLLPLWKYVFLPHFVLMRRYICRIRGRREETRCI